MREGDGERNTVRDAPSEDRRVEREECEVCGSEMYGLHCKLVCPNCGYRRDCSDP